MKANQYVLVVCLLNSNYFRSYSTLILSVSIIFTIMLTNSLHGANADSVYYQIVPRTTSTWNHQSSDFSFQNVYAQSNGELAMPSNAPGAGNENGNSAPAVISPDIAVTIVSLIIAAGITSGIFIFVNYSLKGSNMKFSDIIRDGSGFPSLARFQFLSWTFIVLFSVLGVYLIRILMGTSDLPNNIPENLLILIGISVAVPFVSNPISGIKYGERKPPSGTLTDGARRRLATMLMENEKPSVARFQMFAWTIISIFVYLGFFFSQTIVQLDDVNELVVPDIPQVFVYLMGLSQAGYVGGKATISKLLSVTQLLPKEGGVNTDVIIVGTNFGSEQGRVIFEDGQKDTAGMQIPVPPQNITEWKESRIGIRVPGQGLVANTDYYIRVENMGLTSYKGGGNNDEAKFTVR